jgi:hypothetical protein
LTGLSSLDISQFESDHPGKLNSPAVMLREPRRRDCLAKSLPQQRILYPTAQTRRVSAAQLWADSRKIPAATREDFDPDGFLSSSLTNATQSVCGALWPEE